MQIELIEKAARTILKGGTLIYPTQTLWALGCDATNHKAVEKLLKIKERQKEKQGLICLFDSVAQLEAYVEFIPDQAIQIFETAIRPTTIILPNAIDMPESVTGPNKSIAARITKNKTCQQLIKKVKRPIVSTSANISGQNSVTHINQIDEKLKMNVDYMLMSDESMSGQASSIISIDQSGIIKIIRS